MSIAPIATRQDVAQIGFDNDACPGVALQTPEFAVEAAARPNDGADEVVESLTLHRNHLLQPGHRVIPGRKRPANRNHQPGIKSVWLLLARVDDERDRRPHQNGTRASPASR